MIIEQALLRRSSESSSIVRLELESVARWANENYGFARFDYEELQTSLTEKPIKNAEKEALKVSKYGLKAVVAKRLFILFAHTLEALVAAKKNPTGFGTPDRINVNGIAEFLVQHINVFSGTTTDSTKFYEIETIKSRIEVAIAMKNQFGKN